MYNSQGTWKALSHAHLLVVVAVRVDVVVPLRVLGVLPVTKLAVEGLMHFSETLNSLFFLLRLPLVLLHEI